MRPAVARVVLRAGRPIVLRDTFSRADSALTLGTPDLGPSPTVLSGTWGISSGRAYNASDLDGNLVVWDLATPNGTFEATVRGTLASGTDFRLADLVVRVLDTSNYLRIVCGAGSFNLQKEPDRLRSRLLQSSEGRRRGCLEFGSHRVGLGRRHGLPHHGRDVGQSDPSVARWREPPELHLGRWRHEIRCLHPARVSAPEVGHPGDGRALG